MSSRDLVVAAAGNTGVAKDDYFKNVSLLLSGDGTNGAQNNTFVDSSSNNFTITRNGNTTQGTFSPYGNLWSNYFDGTGDYLSTPSNAAFALSTGDFTIEWWQYWLGGTDQGICAVNSATGSIGINILVGATGYIRVYRGATSTANIKDSTTAPTANTWQHIAVTRSSGTLYFFINGVGAGSAAWNENAGDTSPFTVGSAYNNERFFLGYLSNMRVIKGTALYTSNFTPSTTPLTAVSGTSLLTCQSNRFIDNSSNNFTLTRTGDVKVTKFSPFNSTDPYDKTKIGGSSYFDGTADYLGVSGLPDASGDFTVSFWMYATGFGSDGYGSLISSSAASGAFTLQTWSGGQNRILGYVGAEAGNGNLSPTLSQSILNRWIHITIVRSGNVVTFYEDGVSRATATNMNTIYFSDRFRIGLYSSGGYCHEGYITDVKVVVGTANVPSGVPTSPVSTSTNTKLLCNFTNAGIPDSAMIKNLETVGNAQVSTSVKKYGTGSLYFDGTGDYLTTRDNTDLFDITKCDFTWEAWIYRTVQNVDQEVSNYRSGDGWFVRLTSANKVKFSYVGGSEITSTGSISLNTWTHLAITRSGSTVRIFFNGVQDSSATFANGSAANTALIIGKDEGSTGYYTGYIDDLRITKGVARYIANFTPPAQALPTN